MIDYTEFCEVLQCDPSPQGERLFQLFDYEKSGQIDVREFMIALSNFTGAGKDDKLKFASVWKSTSRRWRRISTPSSRCSYGTTSRRWRGASGICFHTGRMRVAQSAVLCACGAADWKAAAVEAKQKAIDARIIQATAAVTAVSVTAPCVCCTALVVDGAEWALGDSSVSQR